MKAPIRIVTISLILGLAGAFTAAFGAESVIALISNGEAIQSQVKTNKDAYDTVLQRNKQLDGEGKQIVADGNQINADIAAMNKAGDEFNQKVSDYNTKCKKAATSQQYNECKAQQAQLAQESAQLKARPTQLKARQAAWQARAEKYNQDIKDLPPQISAANAKYQNSLAQEEQWLDQARTFASSAAVQPYAQKAGCPDVQKPPRTIDGVNKMSSGLLACFKKIAGTN